MAHTLENSVSTTLTGNETVANTTVTKKQSTDMLVVAANDVDKLGKEAEDAVIMHNAGPFKKARLRIFALLVTFSLEMIVCFVFSKYTDEFNKYPLLIAFQPVISAISGNVGLQCASVNVRALAVGLADVRRPGKSICPELKATAILGTAMAMIIGTVALFWYASSSESTWKGACAFGFATGFGMLSSVLTAALSGSASPLIFKRCGYDPSAMAGPLETAIQDVVGGTVLLTVSAFILESWGDGGVVDQSCGECVQTCHADTAAALNLLQSCLQACLNDVCQ